jgi:hypothetical protein
MTLRHAGRKALALGVLSFAALLVTSAPASAVGAGCRGPVRDLRQAITQLNPTGAVPASGSVEERQIIQQSTAAFAEAKKLHPECTSDFDTLGAQLQAEASSRTLIKGTAFLGPIGWLWNNVYYRVFSGNDVMMLLFGWALLLSPVILVFSIAWVMKGASGALRKPYVPDHLRADL